MQQKILITGAKGFIGKNLTAELKNRGYDTVYPCDVETTEEELERYVKDCTFVFHFAGVNRPKDESEFTTGNTIFSETLIRLLEKEGRNVPVLMSSSIQAALDNPYGISKKAAEDALFRHEKESGSKVMIFRLPGVFGKWCRPNYNSVVATFCHNIANGLPIEVHDPKRELELVYIDDVIIAFIDAMEQLPKADADGFHHVKITHRITLGDLAERIGAFPDLRQNLGVPDFSDPLTYKLYSTYLSYLAEDDFSYPLTMKCDNRGSFTEFIRTPDRGQVSVNVAKPGITKGNHWHHSKNEKFLVVKGEADICFRKVGEEKVITYHVSDQELTVVDIPTGYTHCITNTGEEDLITVMWASEAFDEKHPDTFFEPVIRKP